MDEEAVLADLFRTPSDQVEQPWSRLGAWLREQGHAVSDLEPRQFAGGVANLNYLIRIDGRLVVLRRPPGGDLAEGASDMARESRVLERLSAAYPLAPRGLGFCGDIEILGAPFQLIEYRPGLSVGASLPASVAEVPDAPDRVVTALVEAMAELHRLDPAEVGLETLGKPGFLVRQVAGWGRRSSAAYGDTPPSAVKAILRWLDAHQPAEPAQPSLLHCDFKPDNMLLNPSSLEPVAVVDWDMTTTGHPLFDLGALLAYWIEPGDPTAVHQLGQVPSLQPGFPTRAELARRYLEATGVDDRDLAFCIVLGRLRLAVAWRQLYVLHRRGTLPHPKYSSFDDVAEAVLTWTVDRLDDPNA